jgi:WD40 repeat protein
MRNRMLFYLAWLVLTIPVNAQSELLSPQASEQSLEVPIYEELAWIERGLISVQGWQTEYFAFSPDGSQIAAAASETNVSIWDIETQDVIQSFEHAATSVSWSPDGTLLATGGNDGTVRLWNVQTGMLLFQLEHAGRHITWSPDSTQFATNAMTIFDAITGEPIHIFESLWPESPDEIHWSPNGRLLATSGGHESRHINIWTSSGEYLDTFWGGRSASWSPDSTRLASTSQIRTIQTGLPETIIPAMTENITWHPDEEWIASIGEGGQVLLWNAATGDSQIIWEDDRCWINGFTWSADGNRFALDCIIQQPEFTNTLVIGNRQS